MPTCPPPGCGYQRTRVMVALMPGLSLKAVCPIWNVDATSPSQPPPGQLFGHQ